MHALLVVLTSLGLFAVGLWRRLGICSPLQIAITLQLERAIGAMSQ